MKISRVQGMTAGVVLAVAVVAVWAKLTPEPEPLTVPKGEAMLPAVGGGGEFWAPEMKKAAAEAEARSAARDAEIERLKQAGKIRWQGPTHGGPTSPADWAWVWVETGERLDLNDLVAP